MKVQLHEEKKNMTEDNYRTTKELKASIAANASGFDISAAEQKEDASGDAHTVADKEGHSKLEQVPAACAEKADAACRRAELGAGVREEEEEAGGEAASGKPEA